MEILGSFCHQSLKIFESRESEVTTQKSTRLCNIESLALARTHSPPLLSPLLFVYHPPLLSSPSYYYLSPPTSLSRLFARRSSSRHLVLYIVIYREDERLGENLIFSRKTRVAQQRPRKGPHFSSEGVLPRKIRIPHPTLSSFLSHFSFSYFHCLHASLSLSSF